MRTIHMESEGASAVMLRADDVSSREPAATRRYMREPPRHAYGWFAPLRAGDVPAGAPLTFSFMGHELVAFRDEGGQVGVLEATCPHLGGHLGRGGVVGGCLRCPFHELTFDREGRCGAVPAHYAGARVDRLRARVWASIERYGMIFVWHGPDPARPAYELPLDALDWEGWTTPVTNDGLRMPDTHPLWPAENISDLAHLRTVHRWEVLDVVAPPAERDGVYHLAVDVRWRLGARSNSPWLRRLGTWVHSPFRLEARILDPGIVVAEATLTEEQGGLKVRNLVLVTPVGERDAHLRVVVSVRKQLDAPWIRRGRRLLGVGPEELLARVFVLIGVDDFRSDAEIWRYRRHVEAPSLVKGDGPLVDFRRWSSRFWPEEHGREG